MPSVSFPRTQQRLALATYVRLLRAADSARNYAAQHLGTARLTLTQFAVLEALYHLGPMSLTDIAAKILTTGGNLTMVMGNLEKRGWAHRQRSPEDGRVLIVILTSKGKNLMRRVFPQHAAAVLRYVSALTAEEQQQLGALCRKLTANPVLETLEPSA